VCLKVHKEVKSTVSGDIAFQTFTTIIVKHCQVYYRLFRACSAMTWSLTAGPCMSESCHNGGRCTNSWAMLCTCQRGFQGTRCQYGQFISVDCIQLYFMSISEVLVLLLILTKIVLFFAKSKLMRLFVCYSWFIHFVVSFCFSVLLMVTCSFFTVFFYSMN